MIEGDSARPRQLQEFQQFAELSTGKRPGITVMIVNLIDRTLIDENYLDPRIGLGGVCSQPLPEIPSAIFPGIKKPGISRCDQGKRCGQDQQKCALKFF